MLRAKLLEVFLAVTLCTYVPLLPLLCLVWTAETTLWKKFVLTQYAFSQGIKNASQKYISLTVQYIVLPYVLCPTCSLGYSNCYVFEQMERVHMNKDIKKTNRSHLKKICFSNLALFCVFGFQVLKKCLSDPKTLSSPNLTIGIKKLGIFCWFRNRWGKCEKIAH
jgi:hypothetical protein